jgi:hypothetical protein
VSSAATASAPAPVAPGALARTAWRVAALPWVRIAPAFVVAVVLVVGVWAIQPYPAGIFHDDGVYLILAKSLATGEGYRYLHIPGAPLATHYPPLYPLLLAGLWRIWPRFPENVPVFLFANTIFLALAAWGVYAHARRRLAWPVWLAAAGAIAGCLSLPLLTLTSAVMSEVLFVALLLPLLLSAERLVEDEPTPRSAFALGVAAGALALVRTHALAAVAAVMIVLLVRRRRAAALWCLAGALAALIPWQLWITLHDAAIPAALQGSYGSYFGWFADGITSGGPSFVWSTVRTNLGQVMALLADRLAPWTPGWPRIAGVVLVLGVMSAGAIRARRAAPVTLAFLAMYGAVTLVWPYSPWRFLWALWPFVALLAIEGLRGGLVARRWSLPQLSAAAAALILFAGVAQVELSAFRARAWTTPARSAAGEIAPLMRWITRHTTRDDVLLADAEPLVYLFTGRQVMPPVSFTAREYTGGATLASHAHGMAQLLTRYRVRYVVTVVPSTAAAADRLVASGLPAPLRVRRTDALPNGAAFVLEGR